MSLFEFGGPQYGLQDGKIAANNLDGTFGENFDIPSIQMLRMQMTTVNAELEGDDEITAVNSRINGGTVTMRFGGISAEVLSVILGTTIQSSGAGLASYRFFNIANYNPQYFGVIGRADASEGQGDTHLFAPKLKITEGFELKLEYNTFSIPEITCRALPDENFLDENGKKVIIRPIFNASPVACTLPPTYNS